MWTNSELWSVSLSSCFMELAMNLGETYLVTENGNERLGKQKLDLVVLLSDKAIFF